MGLKNLGRINYFDQPTANPNFFFPLELRLDAIERTKFLFYFNKELKKDINGRPLYSPLSNVREHFPVSVRRINDFVRPIGLKMRHLTVFVGGASTTGKNIHVDGIEGSNGDDQVLEARLSFYELAEAPGIIRWFPKTEEYTKFTSTEPGVYATHWLLPWIQDLKSGKLTWETCPDFEFETTSNLRSAILRTNLPHCVLQGPGIRLTISAQLVWAETGSPVGVWDHIQQNFHLLGI